MGRADTGPAPFAPLANGLRRQRPASRRGLAQLVLLALTSAGDDLRAKKGGGGERAGRGGRQAPPPGRPLPRLSPWPERARLRAGRAEPRGGGRGRGWLGTRPVGDRPGPRQEPDAQGREESPDMLPEIAAAVRLPLQPSEDSGLHMNEQRLQVFRGALQAALAGEHGAEGPGALGQSPPRAGSPPSSPGPFAPSGRGPRPCAPGPGAPWFRRWLLPSEPCRGRRVPTATPGRRWVPRKRGACGSACGLFSVRFWTQDSSGDSPTSRGSLWNEKAQWNLPNNSGSQQRLLPAARGEPCLGQWLALQVRIRAPFLSSGLS